MKFSSTTTKHLGHYVYGLVDPRHKTIFYVGKASANNRAFNHLQIHEGEERKHQRIREIRAAGYEPSVEILRYGLGSLRESFEPAVTATAPSANRWPKPGGWRSRPLSFCRWDTSIWFLPCHTNSTL
jgi:hypothetical protein